MSAIHLIDDSATMLMSMEMLLKRAGYTVTKSESAEAAMTALESISPKLIITDLNMPGMNGIELIKALKQQSKFRFTPMLMLTTESQQSGRLTVDLLLKPLFLKQVRHEDTVLQLLKASLHARREFCRSNYYFVLS